MAFIPIDHLIIQRLVYLEERVARLEQGVKNRSIDVFFASIHGSELFHLLSERLAQCGRSISDVYSIDFSDDGCYVILTDKKRVDFTIRG